MVVHVDSNRQQTKYTPRTQDTPRSVEEPTASLDFLFQSQTILFDVC